MAAIHFPKLCLKPGNTSCQLYPLKYQKHFIHFWEHVCQMNMRILSNWHLSAAPLSQTGVPWEGLLFQLRRQEHTGALLRWPAYLGTWWICRMRSSQFVTQISLLRFNERPHCHCFLKDTRLSVWHPALLRGRANIVWYPVLPHTEILAVPALPLLQIKLYNQCPCQPHQRSNYHLSMAMKKSSNSMFPNRVMGTPWNSKTTVWEQWNWLTIFCPSL